MKPKAQQIHIYCTDELREKLRILSEANDRTMSRQVQALINKAYDEYVKAAKNNLKG